MLLTVAWIVAAAVLAMVETGSALPQLKDLQGVKISNQKPALLARVDYVKLRNIVIAKQFLSPFEIDGIAHYESDFRNDRDLKASSVYKLSTIDYSNILNYGLTSVNSLKDSQPSLGYDLHPRQELDLSRHKPDWMRLTEEDRLTFPFSTTGKLVIHVGNTRAQCTGTLIGPDIIMTADHCLPWNVTAGISISMEFMPAFDAGNNPDPVAAQPFGKASVVKCRGMNPLIDGGHDLAVCQLDTPIATIADIGALNFSYPTTEATQATKSTFYIHGGWWSLGYPCTLLDGNAQAVKQGITIDEMEPMVKQEAFLLKSAAYAAKGWSGGSLWALDKNNSPYIGAIVIAEAGPVYQVATITTEDQCPLDFTADTTLHAGGQRMAVVAAFGQHMDEVDELLMSN
jgi:hypothetical protein